MSPGVVGLARLGGVGRLFHAGAPLPAVHEDLHDASLTRYVDVALRHLCELIHQALGPAHPRLRQGRNRTFFCFEREDGWSFVKHGWLENMVERRWRGHFHAPAGDLAGGGAWISALG